MTQSARYFDSSVILSMLLHDKRADRALELWQEPTIRVSSQLLAIECAVVADRYALLLPDALRASWRTEASNWLSKVVAQLFIHEVDPGVQRTIEGEIQFGKARSLDVIHVATAKIASLEVNSFAFVTFDDRMASLAEEVGIACISS